MVVGFWDVFDQFRYMTGALAAVLLFSVHAVPKRSHFRLRFLAGYCLGLIGAFAFPMLRPLMEQYGSVWGLASAPYWFCMSLFSILFLMFCFDMELGTAFFRGTLASVVEGMATTILRYLIVMIWFPELPEHYPICYILILLAVYIVLYYAGYRLIALKMQRREGEEFFRNRKAAIIYACIYVSFISAFSAVKMTCENVILPLRKDVRYLELFRATQYFCVSIMFCFSICILVILYHIYENVVLQNEKEVFEQLLREKKTQYEFIRENTELINRKCHELKHQLRNLEIADDEERSRMIRQVGNAINFYDAAIKTGNEVLDTILTEKSILCAGRGIKLTCMVHVDELEQIQVIDLYTMLDLALGNAMECAMGLTDPAKKLISFMVTNTGKMIYISIENYYEGEIKLREGLPVMRGRNSRRSHGIKSIHILAKRYGGDIQISLENQIFQMQIILPA